MSYEGYTQYICANHHEFCVGSFELGPVLCDTCGAVPVWSYEVDQTNGCYHTPGEPNPEGKNPCCPVDLVELTRGSTSRCPCCGHVKTVSEPTYRIPPEGVGHRLIDPLPETTNG